MNPHPQPGGGSRGVHAAREGGAVGEQRGASHYSATKSLNDAAVHAVGPSEVIRIDDQIFHSLSVSVFRPVRSYSYSFVRPPVFVPLTVFLRNSSMAP